MKTLVKLIALTAVFTGVSIISKAQVFGEGEKFVQGGIGIGSAYYTTGVKASLPPIHASFEYGFKEKIGLGALIGYTAASSPVPFGGGEFKYSYLVIGARGAYHFYNEDKIDAYGGLMLGFNLASAKYTGSNAFITEPTNVGGFALGAFIGARYALTDKAYLMSELGYSIAWFSIGAGIKL